MSDVQLLSETDVLPTDVQFLLRRQKSLENIRGEWNQLWDYVFDYFPRRPFKATREGNIIGKDVYDGSPGGCALLLTDSMQGYLAAPSFDWFRMGLEPATLEELPGVRPWLQDLEHYFYYVLRTSNFYGSVNELFYDAVTVGTATLFIQENMAEGKVMFSCRHPEEIYIAENQWGQVDVVMRKWRPTYRDVVKIFGDKQIPDDIKSNYQSEPEKRIEMVHWIYPRNDYTPWKIDNKNMPIASTYFLPAGKRILRESGYRTMPALVWRWRKNSSETYGRSPAIDTIYDTIGINKTAKISQIVGQKEAEPPLNVPEEQEGKVRVTPNGMNYYEDPQRIISEIRARGNPQWLALERQRMQEALERNFKVKYWMALTEAQQKGMTATQAMEIAGEKAAVLGPNIGRLDAEVIQPLFVRIYDIEDRAGRLPAPPDILLRTGGQLNIQVMGPLAQAQKKLFQTQGILQSMEVLAPMVRMFPDIIDVIDPDVMARDLIYSYGFPQEAVRSPEKVKQIRLKRVQIQQQQQQIENMQGISQAAKNLATPVPPGSPLEQVGGAIRGQG